MKTASLVAPLSLIFSLVACGDQGGAAPGSSSAPAGGSGAPAAAPAKTSAANTFPAQPVAKPFEALTVGTPPGAKHVEGVTGDYATVEGADYVFKIEAAENTDTSRLKEMLTKAGAKMVIDGAEGILADMPQKDGSSGWMVLRYVKVADKTYKCSTTMKGAPKDGDKAQEAWDACGTLKAK